MRIRNANGDTKTVPDTMWWRSVPLSVSVPNVKLRGRDGAVAVGGNSLEPREFTIEGTMQAPLGVTPATARRDLVRIQDEWLGFLANGPLEVTRSGWDDRVMKAQLIDSQLDWQNGYDWLEVSFSFRAADPYWYSWRPAQQSQELANGKEFSVTTVGGNAPIFPLIRFTGRAQTQNPRLTNLTTGEYVQYLGTVPNAQVLEIDTKRSHATLNGVGAVSKMAPLPFDWKLRPGINRLQMACTGTVGFYINFREVWI